MNQETALINTMVLVANKLNNLKKHLNEAATKNHLPGAFTAHQVNVERCKEAADMISEVCKHLTLTGTKY